MECVGCLATEYEVIQNYLNKDQEALKVFESHGIIPTKRRCELEVNRGATFSVSCILRSSVRFEYLGNKGEVYRRPAGLGHAPQG